MKDLAVSAEYVNRIDEELKEVAGSESISESWNVLKEVIVKVAETWGLLNQRDIIIGLT